MKNLLVVVLLLCFFGEVCVFELDDESYPECMNDDDCPMWDRCLQNICTDKIQRIKYRPECLADLHCPDEEICAGQDCTSVTKFKKCTRRKDCKDDERCGRGYCRWLNDWLFAGDARIDSEE